MELTSYSSNYTMSFPGVNNGKESPKETQETQVSLLGREDPLEKKMATHSNSLAREIPWTAEPGGLQYTGLQRVRHGLATKEQHSALYIQYRGQEERDSSGLSNLIPRM